MCVLTVHISYHTKLSFYPQLLHKKKGKHCAARAKSQALCSQNLCSNCGHHKWQIKSKPCQGKPTSEPSFLYHTSKVGHVCAQLHAKLIAIVSCKSLIDYRTMPSTGRPLFHNPRKKKMSADSLRIITALPLLECAITSA